MNPKIKITDLHQIITANTAAYFNSIVSTVNNHVVRVAAMTSAYRWHYHANSDETFIGVEGVVIIETPDETFELYPGNIITIPKGLIHRTSPQGNKSVNLTIESADMETTFVTV